MHLDFEPTIIFDPTPVAEPLNSEPLNSEPAEESLDLLDLAPARLYEAQTPPLPARRRSLWQQTQHAFAIRDGRNFKGQYAHRVSGSKASIAREATINKLTRYYMKDGMQTKAHGKVLEALSNLYEIMLARPDHELIMRLGGYSPAVGHLIYAAFMHNPNTLLS